MRTFLHGKIRHLLISFAFTVFLFGGSFSVAHAALMDDIANHFKLSVTTIRMLPPLKELPEDIKSQQWQADNIIAGIETDIMVVQALDTVHESERIVEMAQTTCDGAITEASSGVSIETCTTTTEITKAPSELQALNAARMVLEKDATDLGTTLVNARNNQDGNISVYQEANRLAQLVESRVQAIADPTVGQALNQVAGGDTVGSQPAAGGISQQQQDAAKIARANAAAWLNEPVAVNAVGYPACITGKWLNMEIQMTSCFADFVFNLLYVPTSYILIGSGYIFDKMLMLSIEGDMVTPSFIDTTWKIVRDFSNMIFIFVLLYTGIMTMFGAADWRKVVLQVVIVALLINFSLFFTKVVIDAGNILAVGIKSAISGGSISSGLVNSFKPQVFLGAAGNTPTAGTAIIVFLVASVVSLFVAYTLFKVALLFLGRLLGFWFLMIMSPFAFISTTLPSKGNKFQEWLDNLIGLTFVAPVFLFFIYLIIMVINDPNGESLIKSFKPAGAGAAGASWFLQIIGPSLVAVLLIVALQKALHFAESMAGDFGKLGSDLAGKAMGLTAMVATGGTAALARGAIGGGAALALRTGALKEGGATAGVAKWATRQNFDVRNLAGKDSMFGKTAGGLISKAGGSLGVDVGKGGGKGGFEKAEMNREQKRLEQSEKTKIGVFEEQSLREKAAMQEVANAGALTGATADADVANAGLLAQQEAFEKAQEAHAESDTAKTVAEVAEAYENARQQFEKDKGTEHEGESLSAMNELKGKLDTAQSTHANSTTGVSLKNAEVAVEQAMEVQKNANERLAEATTEASKSAEQLATEAIAAINETRRTAFADKVEKGGWLTDGRKTTADKIRKGVKPASAGEKAKNIATRTKDLEEAKTAGKSADIIKDLEEKLEKAKKGE